MNNKDSNFSFLYEKALGLISQKRLQDGKDILERLYNSGNVNKDILNLLGILSYIYCDFSKAKSYWVESLEVDSYENDAVNFIKDVENEEFNILEKNYYSSISLIEDKNYKDAINILEDIEEKRRDLIEVKELLSLLYMIKNKEYKAFDKIKRAIEIDKSNSGLKLIHENINSKIEEKNNLGDINYEIIEESIVSEVVLNLIMILNYKINDVYECEYNSQNEEIVRLKEILESKEEEIKKLRIENKEAFEILEEVRFRNESAFTEELDFEE